MYIEEHTLGDYPTTKFEERILDVIGRVCREIRMTQDDPNASFILIHHRPGPLMILFEQQWFQVVGAYTILDDDVKCTILVASNGGDHAVLFTPKDEMPESIGYILDGLAVMYCTPDMTGQVSFFNREVDITPR